MFAFWPRAPGEAQERPSLARLPNRDPEKLRRAPNELQQCLKTAPRKALRCHITRFCVVLAFSPLWSHSEPRRRPKCRTRWSQIFGATELLVKVMSVVSAFLPFCSPSQPRRRPKCRTRWSQIFGATELPVKVMSVVSAFSPLCSPFQPRARGRINLTNATSASARSVEHRAQGNTEWRRDVRGEAWEGQGILG